MKKLFLLPLMTFSTLLTCYGQLSISQPYQYPVESDNDPSTSSATTDIGIIDNYYHDVIEYTQYPINQTRALTPCAEISNIGGTPVTNVMLSADFNHQTLGTVGSSMSASLPTFSGQDTLCGTSSYTPDQLGNYTIDYSLSLTETDPNLNDNTTQQAFEVTSNLFARDNGTPTMGMHNAQHAYELGNIFEFTNADSINTIQVFIDSNTVIGTLIYGVFYEWDISAHFTYIDQTVDYAITADDLGTWVTLSTSSPISVPTSTNILASIGHYGGPDGLFVGGAQAARLQTSFLLDGSDNTWYDVTVTPMVRLGLTTTALNTTKPNADVLGELSVFPNPSTDAFNINFSQATKGITSIQVINILGEEVKAVELGELFGGETISIDAKNWASGTYILQLNNGTSFQSMKLIKQ